MYLPTLCLPYTDQINMKPEAPCVSSKHEKHTQDKVINQDYIKFSDGMT